MTTLSNEELANLNGTAMEVYARNLDLYLSEPSRLATLYGAQFLRSDMQEQARLICNTATALIGLPSVLVLVSDTEAIAAAHSDNYPVLEQPMASGSLAASFCKFTVNERKPFHVESATQHRLVCYSEAVTGPLGVRAYLGVPVIVRGEAIGSLCVWGPVERKFTDVDVEVLMNLAAVLGALEAGRAA